MIDDVLQIGDKVTITIPKENRDWGYNPCPDGTKATVVGFSEIDYGRLHNFGFKPGIYVNRAWVKLVLEDGREHTEWSGRLELVDQDEYNRCVEAWRQKNASSDWRSKGEYIRALPDTPFWEGDKVRVRARLALTVITSEMPPTYDPDVYVVIRIDYARLNDLTDPGTKWPAYDISDKLGAGWHTSASEDDMELLERGNVWKFYHGEPLEFSNLKEEAEFFSMLGHTEEVRNPANKLYSWTKDEVLEAIRQGIAHGFTMGSEFFGSGPHISAVKFRNEGLGRRVAQATLAGFGLA